MDFDSINSAINFINSHSNRDLSKDDIGNITNAFRYLRNTCAKGFEVQNEIIKDVDLLKNVYVILNNCKNKLSENDSALCLQIGLQFLANLLVENCYNQVKVWNTCQDLLENCLKCDVVKIQNCAAMILYNIFLGHLEIVSDLSHPYADLIKFTLDESKSEFALYILELFIQKTNYVEKFYSTLESQDRIIILEIINSLVNKESENKIKPDLIKFFVDYFIKNVSCILNTITKDVDNLDPVEIIKVLDLLTSLSSDDKHYLKFLQEESSLLIKCIYLLKSIHEVSKQSGNNFSVIQKISELNEIEKNSSVQEHPGFGFKCLLIRMIGNMCWKNKTNQDLVRTHECIPLLLDCCNIDGRNPFIIQWSVLAIRNLCETNLENQKLIASMSKEGVIDALKLQQIGITLNQENDGSGICIAPLMKKE